MNRATSPTGWARNPDGSPGYTWNPITGCKNHTPEGLCLGGLFPCYAFRLANGRLKPLYLANTLVPAIETKESLTVEQAGQLQSELLDPFYPRFWEDRITELEPYGKLKHFTEDGLSKVQIKGIFVCDMGELFGGWIPPQWQKRIFDTIKLHPHFRFYLLTKQPQNLIKWSPFPENCWVGVTATNANHAVAACYGLQDIEAKVKFLSIEPLLAWVISRQGAAYPALYQELVDAGINWLIIGACTGTKKDMEELCKRYPDLTLMPYGKKWTAQPRIEWVQEIVEAADKAGVKVFLKDNLVPLLSYSPDKSKAIWAYSDMGLRQEMPIE